eukprot:SAG22_NODE_1393_length_4514_cov_2.889468_6_plen_190_part_00
MSSSCPARRACSQSSACRVCPAKSAPLPSDRSDNTVFLQHHFAALLKEAFPHLEVGTITAFVEGLFRVVSRKALPFCGASTVFLSKAVPSHVVLLPQGETPAKTLVQFKAHLRDFLVQMKEFEASDNTGCVVVRHCLCAVLPLPVVLIIETRAFPCGSTTTTASSRRRSRPSRPPPAAPRPPASPASPG